MKLLHAFTRGGQLAVHQYRMLKQICVITLLLAGFMGIAVSSFSFFKHTTSYERRILRDYVVAQTRLGTTFGNPHILTQNFTTPYGTITEIKSLSFVCNPWVKLKIEHVCFQGIKAFKSGLFGFVLSILAIILFFALRGYKTGHKKLERGANLVSPRTLTQLIKKSRQDSDLGLDTVPLLKNKETSHIFITGTTGSGKTNCLNTLLPQIRKRPNRAIIVDLTGGFIERYFRPGHDILLNPFDGRSKNWSPWAECLEDSHYDTLAAAIVPKSQSTETFWENAGKTLLAEALRELAQQEEKDIERLYTLLVTEDLKSFGAFFRNTAASSYTHADGEKMTISIRATLANHLQSFRYLKNSENPFSIRKWVAEEKISDQWLFLSAKPEQRETLRPLLSGWIDTAISGLMSLNSDDKRRLWFVIDELPALQKLPSLEIGLAEARKYGGCFLAGIQSIPQIASTYGQNQPQAILDLFNTKIFFRNTDPNTTGWISKVLGETEVTEHIENLSYGANTIRDGVNLAQQTRTKPLVLPTEISALKDCEAYLKLPGTLPVSKIEMSYKNAFKNEK